MILGEAAARPENSKSAAALPKRYFLICKSFHHPFWEWNRLSYLSHFFTPFVILAGLRFHHCGKPPQSGEKEEEPYPLVL